MTEMEVYGTSDMMCKYAWKCVKSSERMKFIDWNLSTK